MEYIFQVMTTHRGIRIIHRDKNTYWIYELSHLVMNYLENNMNLDDTMDRV